MECKTTVDHAEIGYELSLIILLEIKNLLFQVNHFHHLIQKALARGARGVHEPWEESDSGGTVTFAVVQTVSGGMHGRVSLCTVKWEESFFWKATVIFLVLENCVIVK